MKKKTAGNKGGQKQTNTQTKTARKKKERKNYDAVSSSEGIQQGCEPTTRNAVAANE
jgi:hypothetical protein